jgi:DNA-binding transcriptional regulator YiaG
MSAASALPLPATRALRKLGRDLAVARRKRGISTDDMAARLFVSRDTLWRLERGDPKGPPRRGQALPFAVPRWLLSPLST